MARLFALILLLDLALLVVALIECLSADESAIRGLPRIGWVFVILLCAPVGAIAWLVFGRPAPEFRVARTGPELNRAEFRPVGAATPRRAPRGPAGPADDPEFLSGLAAAIKAQKAPES